MGSLLNTPILAVITKKTSATNPLTIFLRDNLFVMMCANK